MNKDEKETAELSPNGRMNMWLNREVKSLERLIEQARGGPLSSQEAYLRGVLSGIRLLQNEWLRGTFDGKDAS